jgi:hypothetical protein
MRLGENNDRQESSREYGGPGSSIQFQSGPEAQLKKKEEAILTA